MKNIIYKNIFGYCVTTEQNYYAQIQNARLIQRCYDFKSAYDIIDYFCNYFGYSSEEFLIVDE